MKKKFSVKKIISGLICALLFSFGVNAQKPKFDISKDLLLVQLDCKTDIDDLHTAAGLVTLLHHPDYKNLKYLAGAGTYGIQEGLYVPPNELMKLAFKNNWVDADKEWEKSVDKVVNKVLKTINNGGSVWVAEAGQSDFTADWVKKLSEVNSSINIKEKIHVVQHSDWNESVTEPTKLKYTQTVTDYHKIDDGNAVGNGTPGLKSDGKVDWESKINDKHITKVWNTAIRLGNEYNGKDGRYLNESIAEGGLDFSDLTEVCYILDLMEIKDADEFFTYFKVE
ncbi:hypothetical protein [Maribacter hydrothermalis]|uniref:Uncharacterized protein n=1 Tax=Maribacter hydrothermalis TaxID=1836467 RepID=A0A1B7Z8G3_9FLAO|nr:hypothetical protein [Maribacter hydrothermalis]APQ18993.1 hypothetical protein BTR34_17430 [Maribacter hydrothermalis]OBR38994.1 hypothetical protein A9200_04845 [Maribacter hydrothermalis]